MTTIETLGVKLGADASEMDEVFKKALLGMTQFQREAERVGQKVTNVGGWIKSLIPAALVTNAIREYGQQEQAVVEVTAALSRQGKQIEIVLPKLREFSELIQKNTQYADEFVLSQMAYGMNLGISADNIEDVTKAAIGLAKITRGDLSSGMMMVTRAGFGHTEVLRRYGIFLSDDMSKTEKFNELIRKGLEAYPMAEKEAGSLTNQMTRMKNAIGELNETFGELIVKQFDLPGKIEATRRAMEKLNNVFQNAPSGLKSAMGWTAIVGAGAPVALKTAGQGIRDVTSVALAASLMTRGAGAAFSSMSTMGTSVGMAARGALTVEGMTQGAVVASLLGFRKSVDAAAGAGASFASRLLPFVGALALYAGGIGLAAAGGYAAGSLIDAGANKIGLGSDAIGKGLGNMITPLKDADQYLGMSGEEAKKRRLSMEQTGWKGWTPDRMPANQKKNYTQGQTALDEMAKEAAKQIEEMMWELAKGLAKPSERSQMLVKELDKLNKELSGLDKTSDKYRKTLGDINKIILEQAKEKEDERKGRMGYKDSIVQDLLGRNSVSMADKLSMLGNRRSELQNELKTSTGSERWSLQEQLKQVVMQTASIMDKGEGAKKQYAGAMLYGSAEAYHAELSGKTTNAKLEQNTGNMVKLNTKTNALIGQLVQIALGKAPTESLGDFLYNE